MCNGNYSCGCENKYTVSKFLFDKFYLKRWTLDVGHWS